MQAAEAPRALNWSLASVLPVGVWTKLSPSGKANVLGTCLDARQQALPLVRTLRVSPPRLGTWDAPRNVAEFEAAARFLLDLLQRSGKADGLLVRDADWPAEDFAYLMEATTTLSAEDEALQAQEESLYADCLAAFTATADGAAAVAIRALHLYRAPLRFRAGCLAFLPAFNNLHTLDLSFSLGCTATKKSKSAKKLAKDLGVLAACPALRTLSLSLNQAPSDGDAYLAKLVPALASSVRHVVHLGLAYSDPLGARVRTHLLARHMPQLLSLRLCDAPSYTGGVLPHLTHLTVTNARTCTAFYAERLCDFAPGLASLDAPKLSCCLTSLWDVAAIEPFDDSFKELSVATEYGGDPDAYDVLHGADALQTRAVLEARLARIDRLARFDLPVFVTVPWPALTGDVDGVLTRNTAVIMYIPSLPDLQECEVDMQWLHPLTAQVQGALRRVPNVEKLTFDGEDAELLMLAAAGTVDMLPELPHLRDVEVTLSLEYISPPAVQLTMRLVVLMLADGLSEPGRPAATLYAPWLQEEHLAGVRARFAGTGIRILQSREQ